MKKNIRLVLLAVMLIVMVAMTMIISSAATIEVNDGDDLQAKIDAAAAGDTIKINGELTPAASITVNKDLIFEGEGSVTYTVLETEYAMLISGNAKVTFNGGKFVSTQDVIRVVDTAEVTVNGGYFESTNALGTTDYGEKAYACFDVATKSTTKGAFTINNGFFLTMGGSRSSACIVIREAIDAVVNDGVFTFIEEYIMDGTAEALNKGMNTNRFGKKWGIGIDINAAATVTVNGGTYYGGDSSSSSACIDITNKYAVLNIYDCNFVAYRGVTARYESTINLYGGSIVRNVNQTNGAAMIMLSHDKAALNIYGGEYVAGKSGNQSLFQVGAGDATIYAGKFVTTPDSDQPMINVNSSGGILTVVDGVFETTAKERYVLRLSDGGAKIYINGGTFNVSGESEARLIYKKNGQMFISGGTFNAGANGIVIRHDSGANNGSLTIYDGATYNLTENSIFVDDYTTAGVKLFDVVAEHKGTGSIIVFHTNDNSLLLELCTLKAVASPIVIDAGISAALNLIDNTITSTGAAAIQMDYELINWTCPGGNFFSGEGVEFTFVYTEAAFKVGNKTYGSARGAALEIQDGEVLEVLADVTGDMLLKSDKTYTVNGNGFTVGSITVTGGNVTLINMNINALTGNALNVDGVSGSVTLIGGEHTAKGGNVINVTTLGVAVVVKDAKLTVANGGGCSGVIITANSADYEGYDSWTADDIAKFTNITLDNVDITGGASTYALVSVSCKARIDYLSGNMTGGMSWFRQVQNGVLNIGNPDATAPQPNCIDASTRAIWMHNASFGGRTNIYGGRFELTSKSEAAYYINAAGAELNFYGGTFIGRINIVSMHDGDLVSYVNFYGGEFLMEGAAHVVAFTAAMSVSYPEWNTVDKAGHIYIGGGYFEASGYGDLFYITSTKNGGTCVIDGGTFKGADARLLYLQKTVVPVVINGGDFSGEGIRLIWAYHGSNLTINGGTYTLLPLPVAGEGETQKVVDFDHCILANGGQSANDIKIYGGTFINLREGAPQVIFCQNPDTRFYVAGGEYYTVNKDGYFIRNMVDLVTGSFKVDTANKKTVNGKELYALAIVGASSNYAPLMPFMPSIRSDLEAQGIRFSATVPASVIATLTADGSTLSYGTIIVPAEFLAGMTGDYLTALKALATSKGVDASKIFVDVVANKGLSKNEKTGDVTFHASLVNIKEENWGRDMVGIAYVKATAADGTVTYHYAAVNTEGALSMTDVATIAFNDNNDAPAYVGAKAYAWRSIKDDNLFNRYSKTKQESFKKYMK